MSILGKNLFQSNRSSRTCTYKCGNACAGEACLDHVFSNGEVSWV